MNKLELATYEHNKAYDKQDDNGEQMRAITLTNFHPIGIKKNVLLPLFILY